MRSTFIDKVQEAGVGLSILGVILVIVGLCRDTLGPGLQWEVAGAAAFLGGLILTCAAAIVEAVKRSR